MSGDLLSLIVFLMAVLGVLALLGRLARSVVRLGLNAAESTAASGLAEISERRGDVTGFMERQAATRSLRRARRRTLALAVGYLLLLAIPPFFGLGREVYAACALLWLLPRPPLPRIQAPPQP